MSDMDSIEFMTHIISEICDYAVENEMEPDYTIQAVADYINTMLKISTFNSWGTKKVE